MPDHENAARLILLELGKPDGASAEHVFHDSEREVAVFDMNELRRPTETLTHLDKVVVAGNDGIAVCCCPVPDRLVVRLSQSNVSDMGQLRKERK